MQVVLLDAEAKCDGPLRRLLKQSAFQFWSFETIATLESAERMLRRSPPDLMFVERSTAQRAGDDWYARLRELDKNLPLVGVCAESPSSQPSSNPDYFDYIVLDDSENMDRALNFARIAGEARQALRIAEENLRLAEEMGDLGTWVWHIASDEFVLSDQNRSMSSLVETGFTSGADWLSAVHPDDRVRVAASFETAVAGAGRLDEVVRINRNPHGPAPDYRTLHAMGRVVRRGDGSPYKMVGVCNDITDKVALAALSVRASTLEQRLIAAEAEFRTLFDSSIDCLYFLVPDDSGKLVYAAVNPRGMMLVPVPFDQVRGKGPVDVLDAEMGATIQANLQRCFETGEAVRCQPTYEMLGQTVTFDTLYSPVRGAGGELLGVLGSCRDISEQRRTEHILQQSQELKAIGQLASGVAHDFNNLLAAGGSFLQMIDKYVEAEKGRLILAEGQRTIERGRSLTTRLLRLAHPTLPKAHLANLDDCLRAVGDTLTHTLGSGIRIDVTPEAPGAVAPVDPHEVELALINLAVNARDAMPDGGSLQLSSRMAKLGKNNRHQLDPGSYVIVSMRDTGTGMAPDILAKATDPFFTTKLDGEGTGLGLSIVAKLMHDHGGNVQLESEVGSGTCVSLFFPKVSAGIR